MSSDGHRRAYQRQAEAGRGGDLPGQQVRRGQDELASLKWAAAADPDVGMLVRAVVTPQLGKVGVVLLVESPHRALIPSGKEQWLPPARRVTQPGVQMRECGAVVRRLLVFQPASERPEVGLWHGQDAFQDFLGRVGIAHELSVGLASVTSF